MANLQDDRPAAPRPVILLDRASVKPVRAVTGKESARLY
ncbi:hypothetical protein L914_14754 [Phytophthora nicotianae]|uniref:Uncharacterized protein n=1 Tax=Phytophthora nicotianae TaxID=4792 RepID=W2IF36_PHYNI|nr:hypothetical protein L916_14805 [Phytophthora nicotianae]ETM39053.1 hypothetical protein L914_14754 [Phytophthora nicotianae]